MLGFEVPECDVDGSHREQGDAAAADPVGSPPHLFPDPLDVGRVLPENQRRKLLIEENLHGSAAAADRIAEAHPRRPLVGVHGRGDHLHVGELLDGVDDLAMCRETIERGFDTGDFHEGSARQKGKDGGFAHGGIAGRAQAFPSLSEQRSTRPMCSSRPPLAAVLSDSG